MNRGQRRARWQSHFRQESAEKAAVAASSARPISAGLTRGPALSRQRGSVQLRIGELVLPGFGRGSERGIARSLERELGRVLIERGVPHAWMHNRSLENATANKLHIRVGENGHSVGERLARLLYEIPG
jgi:hypothetical protein